MIQLRSFKMLFDLIIMHKLMAFEGGILWRVVRKPKIKMKKFFIYQITSTTKNLKTKLLFMFLENYLI